MTDLTESPDWALGCMTAILGDMRHDLGIARHMIHSPMPRRIWSGRGGPIIWTKNTRP